MLTRLELGVDGIVGDLVVIVEIGVRIDEEQPLKIENRVETRLPSFLSTDSMQLEPSQMSSDE